MEVPVQALPRLLCSSDAIPSPAISSTRTRALGGVGLLGCGTVGSGVARRLIASHPGLIKGIAVRDPRKPRDVAWDEFGGDPFDVVDDPSVRVVVECIGGLGLARELVLRAIARGKDVVTANKDLIATEGPWLAAFAARTGASLRYEAAVGGAIPIVRALAGSLADEDVIEIGGVLNGTTNFVLDAMEAGAEYADALAEAQRLGFAEQDPRSDVDGHDAAHKLAILAGLAFRKPAVSPGLARRGIGGISREDVQAGAERGLRLKLVAVARRAGDAIEAGVTPAFVPEDHPFARPRGAENVVRVLGRGCGPLVFSGFGAGGDATASAVVADVLAALDARERVPAHGGEDLVAKPLSAPLLVRFAEGSVITNDAVSLDRLEAAAGAFGGRGEVRSVIPVWRDAA
ncbi:MAG TPA: homoserine dehydrogenase [Candidatus Elarobacter sp.]|jgi:homoserine dehydrogenase|nr:homoserine dehydrogenase [Candidatus Elarobacter sp.]